VSFAQIDWHDFVVVETVEFKESETGQFLKAFSCFLFQMKMI
jgi:hypothetical protein